MMYRQMSHKGDCSPDEPRAGLAEGEQFENKSLSNAAEVLLHELKQPLLCILALAERLDRSINELTPAQFEKQPIMKRDVVSLLVSVQQMRELMIAGVNFLGDDYCFSDWGKRLNSSCQALKTLALSRGMEIRIENTLEAFEDGPDMKVLHQVLSNLMLNSIEAMEQDHISDPKIFVEAFRDAHRFKLRVHDSGQGVPAEIREKIFERGHSTKLASGGSGLGLWLCRKLSESRGGQLNVGTSEILKGACFELNLPLKEKTEITSLQTVIA